MSGRNKNIFHLLVRKKVVSEEELLEKFNISVRQLSYSIEMINEQLSMEKLSEIEKKDGYYYSSLDSSAYFLLDKELKNIFFPKEDRIKLILLMILTRTEPLSLDHFSIDLKISKNTALTYVKKAKIYLAENDLNLEFDRKDGYRILGDEWDKRIVLYRSINKLYKQYGEKIVSELMETTGRYINDVKQDIVTIENYLNIKYVDEEFYPLIHFISAIVLRVKQGKVVEARNIHDKKEIEGTVIYQSLNYLTSKLSILPTDEKEFIALQLLSTNVRNNNTLAKKDLPLLENALWEFLTEFEASTFLVLKDKKELLQKLINHFRPAYYRIKYNISVENVLYDRIRSEYRVLHNFVCDSISPLEKFFQTKISDEEIAYITLFIGGHLIEKNAGDFEDKVIKAVILCPNGISMSNLIEKTLKELFPEFLFYPTSSVREYQDFRLPHDIVFSTVPVYSSKRTYIIDDIPSKSEQIELRQHVLKEMFQLDFTGVNSEDILSIVKNHTTIKNEGQLKDELNSLILKGKSLPDKSDPYQILENNRLVDLLSKNRIVISEEELEWGEALKKLSNVLINNGTISSEYREVLLHEYLNMPSFILLRRRVALPHLDPNLIEQQLGVSLLVAKGGILYDSQIIHLVILLTTPDKTSHLGTLYDINEIANDKKITDELSKLCSAEQVIQRIKNFFKNKENWQVS